VERDLGEGASRFGVAGVQDGELAVERLGVGAVALRLGQHGPPVHERLARDRRGRVGRHLELGVELARALPVLRAIRQVGQQRERARVVRHARDRVLELAHGRLDLAAREEHARVRHEVVRAQGRIRLDRRRAPVGLLGALEVAARLGALAEARRRWPCGGRARGRGRARSSPESAEARSRASVDLRVKAMASPSAAPPSVGSAPSACSSSSRVAGVRARNRSRRIAARASRSPGRVALARGAEARRQLASAGTASS
jgi:hypothetical protein